MGDEADEAIAVLEDSRPGYGAGFAYTLYTWRRDVLRRIRIRWRLWSLGN